MVQDDVGSHGGEDFVDARTLAFNQPADRFSSVDTPSFSGKHDIVKPGDAFLVKLPNPSDFPIRQR